MAADKKGDCVVIVWWFRRRCYLEDKKYPECFTPDEREEIKRGGVFVEDLNISSITGLAEF
jgi:hypothetical protein